MTNKVFYRVVIEEAIVHMSWVVFVIKTIKIICKRRRKYLIYSRTAANEPWSYAGLSVKALDRQLHLRVWLSRYVLRNSRYQIKRMMRSDKIFFGTYCVNKIYLCLRWEFSR